MKVEMPPGEVLDRLAILFVKSLFLAASKDADENIRFYKNFKRMCFKVYWSLDKSNQN